MGTRKQMEQALRRVLTGEGLSRPDYSIVIPVIWTQDGPELLIEVRAAGISQEGDPCFPGGRIEPGETPARAAVRSADPIGTASGTASDGTYLSGGPDRRVCGFPSGGGAGSAPDQPDGGGTAAAGAGQLFPGASAEYQLRGAGTYGLGHDSRRDPAPLRGLETGGAEDRRTRNRHFKWKLTYMSQNETTAGAGSLLQLNM